MMKYSDIKKRMSLQAISTFIYFGSDRTTIDLKGFDEREQKAFSQLEKGIIHLLGADKKDEIIKYIMDYADVIEENCFCLGMKVGASVHCQLTNNLETDV